VEGGILTDTGGLHHAVRQLTFDACSKLLALKVDFSQLNKDIFDRNSETKLRVTGYVLSKKMKVFPEFKLVLASINSIELAKLNSVKGDTEGLVNQLLSIECAEVAVLITERIPGNVRISFRSKGLIPVNTFVSNNFRGGGHRNAAGGSYMGKVSDVIKIIMQSYPEYVSDYL
jgi:phosphoesterase RecJ-like protein